MKPSDAAKEIHALLEDLKREGGSSGSEELRSFLIELELSPGLKKPLKASISSGGGKSATAAPRVGARPKRPPEADMSKTIDELAKKLSDAFNSDDGFEKVLNDPQTQKLSKANVVTLYKRIFSEARPPSKAMTKPEVFNAIRRERISRVRSGY